MKKSFPAATCAWLILLFVASFLTWGNFENSFHNAFGGFPTESPVLADISISSNAWKSYLRLFGMSIPNWLPIVAAFGAVGALYALSRGAELADFLPDWLLMYALFHTALFGFLVWENGSSSLGVGVLITLFALGGIWRAVIKSAKRDILRAKTSVV